MAVPNALNADDVLDGLLQFCGTMEFVPVDRFVVADNFKVGNMVGGRKIGSVGKNFLDHFGGVTEKDVPARIVPVWQLVNATIDAPVIVMFGGIAEPKVQLHLSHLFQMMEQGKQGKGRFYAYVNFSYLSSPRDGRLWAPHWSFGDGEDDEGGDFEVEASRSTQLIPWTKGFRVCGG